ncbi:major capsid protein [Kitasatospora sp. NPDC058170]|uniref:major capsid protein n=1 Tax=Kitasatospora sp. NPDC058170 TaxID=3346364 RepID=UPI0036DA5AFA
MRGDADVDKFIAMARGDPNDQHAIQETLKIQAASIHFADQFFNGDTAVNPLGFDGLCKRLIGRQVIDSGRDEGLSSPQENIRESALALRRSRGILIQPVRRRGERL